MIGSLWNAIFYTDNNGGNWRPFPTPLDQGKYAKTNRDARPELNRVAIFKNYLLVKQEELFFFSDKSSIDWKHMPDVIDFFTDANNTALYFVEKKGTIRKVDDALLTIHTFAVMPPMFDAKCHDGKLYIATGTYAMVLNEDYSVAKSAFYNYEPVDQSPRHFGNTAEKAYGILGSTVYYKAHDKEEWHPAFELPFIDDGSIALLDRNHIIYRRNDDSLFYFDSTGKCIEKTIKENLLSDFMSSPVEKIVFSKGSYGCFHNRADSLVYAKDIGFSLSDEYEYKNFRSAPSYIDQTSVKNFVSSIHELFDPAATVSVDQLGFEDKNYEQCRKSIIAFQEGKKVRRGDRVFYLAQNNINFKRLMDLVDSVKYLRGDQLTVMMRDLESNFSTTTNWVMITLTNKRGQTLSLSSSFDRPNAYYFPWRVHIAGVTELSNSLEIYRFIKQVYPSFFDTTDKTPVLQDIVRKMYTWKY